MTDSTRPTLYHIPVCPFSQRLEILLKLKGCRDAVAFEVIDITKPRPPFLLELTGGSTALPVLRLPDGRALKESMVLLRYFEEALDAPKVARDDPYERAVERLMITREGDFTMTGYRFVLNQDRSAQGEWQGKMLDEFRWLDDFLMRHNPEGTWLFDRFGLAETVFTPMFWRFLFLEYYEGFTLPQTDAFRRVARWRTACMEHPCAQQVSHDEIVKLYYDYAVGAGNGALPEGRSRSSFVFEPPWQDRPMPPRDTYDRVASDRELGLIS